MDDNIQLDGSPARMSMQNSRDETSPKSDYLIRFRNYNPQNSFLDGLYTSERTQPESFEEFIKDKFDMISDNKYRIDPKLMEPKKIDWDLKQRIEKRLDILERETRKSISHYLKDSRRKR